MQRRAIVFVICMADFTAKNDWRLDCFKWHTLSSGVNVWLKLTMVDFVYVFDSWRKWSWGVICAWPRTNSDTIVSMLIWFCYLEWMIYGGKFIWCDLLTSNMSGRRNSFGLGLHFCQQNKLIPLKKIIIRTTCKAGNCFSNVARVKYSIVTSHLIYIHVYFYYIGKICTDITPTNSRAKWEDYLKASNYVTIDFH